MTDHLLQLGSLDLTNPSTMAYTTHPLADGFDMGSPVPLLDALAHLLLDGEIVSGKRSSNRTLRFYVEVRGDDSRTLAEAERDLIAEVDKPNTLLWKWPGLNTPTTEFQTFRGTCVAQTEDIKELRGVRVYEVTLPAMPFGRSTSETIVEALPAVPVSPTTTTLTSGTTTTGWPAGVVAGTAAVNLPQVTTERVPVGPYSLYGGGNTIHTHEATFTPASPVATGTDPTYLVIRVKEYEGGRGSMAETPTVTVNGTEAEVASMVSAGSGFYDIFYLGVWGTISSVKVQVTLATGYDDTAPTTAPLSLIKVTDDVPAGSPRQQLRVFEVGGSVRAPGTVQIDHATAGLGDVLVYTGPALNTTYRPDLMRWFVSGGGTTSVTGGSVSGSARLVSTTPTIFSVPAASLPEGGYVVMGRLSEFSASTTFTITAATRQGSTDVATQTATHLRTDVIGVDPVLIPLAAMVLPPATSRGGGSVRISIASSNAGKLDELWLFYMGEDSALTVVTCGAGTPAVGSVHNRLDLEAPSLGRSVPSVWVGTTEDRSDFFHPGALASDIPAHLFVPPSTRAFVVTTGANNPSVSYRYRKHWHTHAAED